MNTLNKNIFGLILLGTLSACTPSASQMSALLEKNPEILTNAILKNPEKFMEAVQKASQSMQGKEQQMAEKAEQDRMAEEAKNPLQPEIDEKRGFMGKNDAAITIVEYTDFQCPFCSRGYDTLEQVRKTYGAKVRVLVKNLPLPMHPMAMPASKRFEAIKLQNVEKGYAFYHAVFTNQKKLDSGESFLDATAKKVGADIAKMKTDMESEAVKTIIAKDMAEAEKFGISGTPGFIINGTSVRGAYPFETFKGIIDQKLAAK